MKNSLVKAAFAILITYFNIVPVYSQVFPASENNINLRWDKQRGVLSATAIDWPTDKPMVAIRSLSSVEKSRFRVSSIKLKGYKGELKWLHNKAGLKVTLPLKEIEDNTFVLDISIARIPNHLPLDYPNYQRSIDRGIEEAPVPEYEWASEEAYEAMNDMKYGIRIHWGIYSIWEQEASWELLKISYEERMKYWELYKQFNPKKFNADSWMSWIRDNGMKMFAFTTKHHDGFSMFDTKTKVAERINWTAEGGPQIEPFGMEYDIMQTPFKRDIVKELCESARKHDIKIDLYYTNPDWLDADQRGFASFYPEKRVVTDAMPNNTHHGNLNLSTITPTGNKELMRGMKRHRDQLKEILTNYGKIDMVCLDMWFNSNAWPEMRKTMLEIRKIQPNVMFRCRSIGHYGDYYTPERWVPGDVEATNMPWFVIYPLGKLFAFDPVAEHYQSGQWIINNLIDATSKGGNIMVAIGPDKDGVFHPTAIKSVEDAGDWLRINGEAIFATRPWNTFGEGPIAEELISSTTEDEMIEIEYSTEDIRFTRSKDRKTIYAILMGWPDNEKTVTIESLSKKADPELRIKNISLLGYSGTIKWEHKDEGLKVIFPDDKPCNYAYSLKISIAQ